MFSTVEVSTNNFQVVEDGFVTAYVHEREVGVDVGNLEVFLELGAASFCVGPSLPPPPPPSPSLSSF
jgi:hypothetical protein